MNDCLYELYAVTNEENYARAAHKFDEVVKLKLNIVFIQNPCAKNKTGSCLILALFQFGDYVV